MTNCSSLLENKPCRGEFFSLWGGICCSVEKVSRSSEQENTRHVATKETTRPYTCAAVWKKANLQQSWIRSTGLTLAARTTTLVVVFCRHYSREALHTAWAHCIPASKQSAMQHPPNMGSHVFPTCQHSSITWYYLISELHILITNVTSYFLTQHRTCITFALFSSQSMIINCCFFLSIYFCHILSITKIAVILTKAIIFVSILFLQQKKWDNTTNVNITICFFTGQGIVPWPQRQVQNRCKIKVKMQTWQLFLHRLRHSSVATEASPKQIQKFNSKCEHDNLFLYRPRYSSVATEASPKQVLQIPCKVSNIKYTQSFQIMNYVHVKFIFFYWLSFISVSTQQNHPLPCQKLECLKVLWNDVLLPIINIHVIIISFFLLPLQNLPCRF